jgi:SRSO17 transposase
MDRVRPVIEEFATSMFGGLARRDQRGKGELYLRGLLLDGKRKSMQPMAERLGVDHQQLQQFVTTSTWDHVQVRRRLAVWAGEFVDPDAWVVDDTDRPVRVPRPCHVIIADRHAVGGHPGEVIAVGQFNDDDSHFDMAAR